MDKIKKWLFAHRVDVAIVLILVLTVTAAFQLGRLSVIHSEASEFSIETL